MNGSAQCCGRHLQGSLAQTLSLSSGKLGEFASTPSHISSLVAETLILQKRLSKINDGVGEEHHLSPGLNLGTSDVLGSLLRFCHGAGPQYT